MKVGRCKLFIFTAYCCTNPIVTVKFAYNREIKTHNRVYRELRINYQNVRYLYRKFHS